LNIKPPTGYTSVRPLLKNHRVALPTAEQIPAFVHDTHALPLSLSEIAPASRDYPVAFSSADGGKTFTLSAVLGLQQNQNMYLMDDGHWDRRVYLPAYVRRYPFCMARVTKNGDAQGERVVCVDDSALDANGDELFDEKGDALPTWSRIESFVTEYERDLMRSEEFCKLLAELGLLEPISVTAELGEFTMQLAGFHRVQREALATMPEKSLRSLLESDAMDAIFAHLWSLSNFQRMLDRRSVFPEMSPQNRHKPN